MRFPVRTGGWVVIGATCWLLSAIFFVDQVLVQAALTTPYSLTDNYISELGISSCGRFVAGAYHHDVCSPLHGLMNGTFMATGILQVVGADTTSVAWPRRRFAAVGAASLIAAAVSLIFAGLTPMNVDPGSHARFALIGILCVSFAVILYGIAVLPASRALAGCALAAGIAGISFLAILQLGGTSVPVGLVERLAVYPPIGMIVMFGGVMVLGSRPSSRPARAAAQP